MNTPSTSTALNTLYAPWLGRGRVSIIRDREQKIFLINLAPLKSTERKKVATKHAIAPWFGEGKQSGDRSGCRQLQGKTTHHYCHNTSPSWWEEKILVPVSSFFATFMSRKRAVDSSPSSKESNQVILLSFSIQCPWQIRSGNKETTSSITY